jgi:hypothetical protein
MNVDPRLSIHDIKHMLARGRELRSPRLRRYLLAAASRLLASVADRQRQRVSVILDHAEPDRRSDRSPRPEGIGARWHRW